MPSYAICVSVWYEKWQFLGLKLVKFCHFRSLNNHENALQEVFYLVLTISTEVTNLKHSIMAEFMTKFDYLL